MLSGSMMGIGYIDLYTQYKFLCVPDWPTTKDKFITRFCEYEVKCYGTRAFKQITNYINTDEIKKLISPHSYAFSTPKPEHTSGKHYVEVDKSARKHYDLMRIKQIINPPTILGWDEFAEPADIIPAFKAKAAAAAELWASNLTPPNLSLIHI